MDGKDSEACGRARRLRAEVGDPPLLIYSFDLYLTREQNDKKNNLLFIFRSRKVFVPPLLQ